MDLNKLPRWALVYGFMGFMSLCGLLLRGAFADLDETKARSLRTEQFVQTLADSLKEITEKQASFEVKYDRNQEENQRVFRQILAAIKS